MYLYNVYETIVFRYVLFVYIHRVNASVTDVSSLQIDVADDAADRLDFLFSCGIPFSFFQGEKTQNRV